MEETAMLRATFTAIWIVLITFSYAQGGEAPGEKQITGFFQKDGKFNRDIYTHLLEYTFNTGPASFEAETRDSLLIIKLQDLMLKDAQVSKDEVKEAYKKEFSKAEFSYFIVKQKDFEKEVELTEDELRQFYRKNPADFRIPEQINIEYLKFMNIHKRIS